MKIQSIFFQQLIKTYSLIFSGNILTLFMPFTYINLTFKKNTK